MKRALSFCLSLLLLGTTQPFAPFVQTTVQAEENEDDSKSFGQLRYIQAEDHIEITGCEEDAEEISIPTEIDGLQVTVIAKNAFRYCTKLRTVVIPEGVTTIGNSAFDYCVALNDVTLPQSLTEIEHYAFCNCSSLTSIVIPDSVTKISNYTFFLCPMLSTVKLPKDLGSIGSAAFDGCAALKTIDLPESLTVIGDFAFAWSGLTSISIPATVTSIETGAFLGCKLTDLTISPDNRSYKCKDSVIFDMDMKSLIYCSCAKSGAYSIPEGVTRICEDAFYACDKLPSVDIPDTVKSIGYQAFNRCAGITEITLPNGITEIDTYTFSSCSNLNSITLPDSLTIIRDEAFSGCGLQSIVLPQNVVAVADDAFDNCDALSSVTFLNPQCRIPDDRSRYSVFPKSAVVYGYPGSTAEAYAQNNAHSFVALEGEPTPGFTYEVIPLLEPFNTYFYVRTENPNPHSFRFVDKETVYGNEGTVSLCDDVFCDIEYEDADTLRVSGGYIFKGSDTDGGTLTLQKDVQTNAPTPVDTLNLNTGKWTTVYERNEIWEDFPDSVTVPAIYSGLDYLVQNYATADNFFDNMDAVQQGFSSICLYSGSYVRGELYRTAENWAMSTSPHADQTFYIQSPYSRTDSRSLFASALYPFRYDSLGFPSIMKAVAQRLDSTAEVERDDDYHSRINVTYNGITKQYGGQGTGEGQGISEEMITRRFTFAESDESSTLEEIRALLDTYAAIEMPDDVPQEDKLTWEAIYDAVGEGTWVRMISFNNIFGLDSGIAYAYLYQNANNGYYYVDGDFYAKEMSNGGSLYWWGILGYGHDAWIDGRYIDKWERFVPGAVFEDYPESDIYLQNVTVPTIDYDTKYNYETMEREYINVTVQESTETILFKYDSEEGIWKAKWSDYDLIKELTDKQVIDGKYLDMVQLTTDEVKALGIDKNTNTEPQQYLIYDGSVKAGTAYPSETHESDSSRIGDLNKDGEINLKDVVLLRRYIAGGWNVTLDEKIADCNGDGTVNLKDVVLLRRYIAGGWNVKLTDSP